MTQVATVEKILRDGYVQISVPRKSACGHDCEECAGCGMTGASVYAEARDPVGVRPGDKVVVESSTRAILAVTWLVYMLPVMFFLLGYFLSAGLTEGWRYAVAIAAAVVLLPELVPYAMGRLSSWRDPFADPLGEGHQTIQSLYAIASGGAAGLGLGNSRQKYLYVPEPQNDFIFSILCEELGFVGAALTVVLFLLLFLRGMSIAVRARDKFGALLAVGFVVQVVLQAVLNIAVVTNTIPNTGISLPFFSSGGTSLMMLLGEMGIVLSVSRQADAR